MICKNLILIEGSWNFGVHLLLLVDVDYGISSSLPTCRIENLESVEGDDSEWKVNGKWQGRRKEDLLVM